jgi:hypothetical protein
MARPVVSVLAGVACVLGAQARPAAAQQMPSRDSLLAMAHRALPAFTSVRQCPMPVAVPDLSRSERMPVAPTDARGHYIRVVPPGCVNPLFHGPTPGPASSFPPPWSPLMRHDSLPALRLPFPGAASIPALRLPLRPWQR